MASLLVTLCLPALELVNRERLTEKPPCGGVQCPWTFRGTGDVSAKLEDGRARRGPTILSLPSFG